MKRTITVASVLALVFLSIVCKKPQVGSPPATPDAPVGTSSGGYNTSYQFTAFTTDPDSDSVAIRFSWGDGATSDWSAWFASGETVAQTHSWPSAGSYQVKAQAKDNTGLSSSWSSPLAVTITTNRAPNTPATPTGPSSVRKDTLCIYTSIATDPDGDGVSYRFAWGNGDSSAWSGWTQSGSPGAAGYAYPRSGTFQVRAQARDANEALSAWSNPLQVAILNPHPPDAPSTPSGASVGSPDTAYSFSSSATDPDGDSVAIRFDWGDNDTSNWSSYGPSGQTDMESHPWRDSGTYYVTVQAKDEDGALSPWSSGHQIKVWRGRPNTPSTPSGPSDGQAYYTYTFWSSATDPDGDSVAIRFDWGDEISDWGSYHPSGQTVGRDHMWTHMGDFSVKAQAKDVHGAPSDWSSGHMIHITY